MHSQSRASHMDVMPLPLDGVRVLDLSRLLPGPLCGQHLADLGADVIKIEDPRIGDYARSSLRELVNRGKRALSLDLKSEPGREIFLRLVAEADVIIESFRPGVMARLGLDHAMLRARHPSLIYCSITGFGQDGPRAGTVGHDINYVAISGVLERTGSSGGPPVIPGFLLADILGGTLTAAMGILAALFGTRNSGVGRFIDVSMYDALLTHSVLHLAELQDADADARGGGRHTGGMANYNVYETRDGRYLAVGAQEPKFWNSLCAAIGLSDLAHLSNPKSENESQLVCWLRARFLERDAQSWMTLLQPMNCCVTPVLSLEEALADPHTMMRSVITDSKTGKPTGFRFPLVMTGLDAAAPGGAPSRGQHNAEILQSLGYERAEIKSLAARGVI